MTKNDVKRIFLNGGEGNILFSNGSTVTVENFLYTAGFKQAKDNPTKQNLHDIDKGIKGYSDLIESGFY